MQKQKSFDKEQTSGTLYLIPTPIGNLEDMSFRAVRMLKEVTLIASEDTRNTQKLLNHFEIQTPQISFHEHNYQERIPKLIDQLNMGNSIGQVSDAGMPCVSDPGMDLVKSCIIAGVPVVSLPGPTAGLTALIASGLLVQPFTFLGFLPRKKNEQKKLLQTYLSRQETMIFYESPYRVKQTMTMFQEVFGSTRQVVICRELTKIHEEYLRGTVSEILSYLQEKELKGECCLLLEGISKEEIESQKEQEIASWEGFSIVEHIDFIVETENISANEAIKKVAKQREMKKQEVYKAYHQ